jgi:orotidine-5'-phosphate decarboxylase
MDRGESCAELLAGHFEARRHLVVGLDPDLGRMPAAVAPGAAPAERVVEFNRRVVEATADVAAAYKPNSAFYEALGEDGFFVLEETIGTIRRRAPGAAVILDAKRADIGSTNAGYAAAAFERLGADAITVHPYLGGEALAPFLERSEKLVFVLARTSNPGAGELQDLVAGGVPLYRHVARAVAGEWNSNGNCGLVVGATYPEEMRAIRADVPAEMPILVPGAGAQGGDVAAVVSANLESGSNAFLIAASRSILYTSPESDFADAARAAAESLDREIREASR